MNTNKLTLYFIDEDYINYLRKFDDKVRFNKNKTRPYLEATEKVVFFFTLEFLKKSNPNFFQYR